MALSRVCVAVASLVGLASSACALNVSGTGSGGSSSDATADAKGGTRTAPDATGGGAVDAHAESSTSSEASSVDAFRVDSHRTEASAPVDAPSSDATDAKGVDAFVADAQDASEPIDANDAASSPFFVALPAWDAGPVAFEGGVPANQVMRPGVPDASYATVEQAGDLFFFTDALNLDGGLTDDAAFPDATPGHEGTQLHWNGPGPDSVLLTKGATVNLVVPAMTTSGGLKHVNVYAAAQNADNTTVTTKVVITLVGGATESHDIAVPDWGSTPAAGAGFVLVDKRGRVGGSEGNQWSIFGFTPFASTNPVQVTKVSVTNTSGSQLYLYAVTLW